MTDFNYDDPYLNRSRFDVTVFNGGSDNKNPYDEESS